MQTTIYLDTLICVNLFIDYIVLLSIKSLLHINVRNRRVLLGSFLGALATLGVLLPVSSIFLSALYKISTAVLTLITAYGFGNFQKSAIRLVTYLGINMIISATVVTINLLYKPTGVFIFNNELYFDVSPKLLVISTAIIYIILSLYKRLNSSSKLKTRIYRVSFTIFDNKTYTFDSALDTGCNLREPFSDLPVIIAERELIKDIDLNREKMRIIPYSTVSESAILYGFKPKTITINNKIIHSGCYIGICENKIKGEVRAIMGPQIVEDL